MIDFLGGLTENSGQNGAVVAADPFPPTPWRESALPVNDPTPSPLSVAYSAVPLNQYTPLPVRFWSRVDKSAGPDGCWIWMGGRARDGYGRVQVNRRSTGSHRVAYVLANRPILDTQFVLHRCDVRSCVNPAHLFLGDHQDNADDRNRKQRQARGSRQGLARLTESQVVEIRASAGRIIDLARRFGVAQRTIRNVIARETWKHVGA